MKTWLMHSYHSSSRCRSYCATLHSIWISRMTAIDSMRRSTVLSYHCVTSMTARFLQSQFNSRKSWTTLWVLVSSRCNFPTTICAQYIMSMPTSVASLLHLSMQSRLMSTISWCTLMESTWNLWKLKNCGRKFNTMWFRIRGASIHSKLRISPSLTS